MNMAYRIEKHVGGTVYVYEATSSWDAEKKQPRQTRTYLGKLDPQTGKVIPPRHSRTPRHAKDYGNWYVLQQIATQLGLPALLQQIFSEDAPLLLALALFEISEAAPLYVFPHWVETTHISDIEALSAVELTRFTQRLGRMDAEREEFFRRWIAQCSPVQTMVFDITSLSSYSTLLSEVEWGYNRDHDPLPQVNLGMVYAEDTHMPLYYQMYPGSIRDVSTLSNMLRYCEAFELVPDIFVMDRGFYSAANVAALTDQAIKFLLPLPRSVGLFTELLRQQYATLTALPNSFLFHNDLLCHIQTAVPLNLKPIVAHIFFNPSQFYAQASRFLTRLWQAEAALQGCQFHAPQEVQQVLSHQVPGAAKFFRCSATEQQVTTVRDSLAIQQHLALMGITIFLTNHADLDRLQLLSIYRQKDVIEKAFDVVKHELDGQRLRGHSPDAIAGRLFLKFLSLIVYSALQRTMRDHQLFTEYSVRELLYELKKLRVVEMLNGQCLLTEISKRQRQIFNVFDIAVPTLKNLVTKT